MRNYELRPRRGLAKNNADLFDERTAKEKLRLGVGEFTVMQKGHLFKLESINTSTQPDHLVGVKRDVISGFSNNSRVRLIREVCSYGKLVPLFVTLTYGENYPDPRRAKDHLKFWWAKVLRRFPGVWAVWKLEFQERGAPHFHLLIYIDGKMPKMPATLLNDLWLKTCKGFSTSSNSVDLQVLKTHRGGVYYATKYLCKEDVYVPSSDSGGEGSVEGSEAQLTDSAPPSPGRFWGVLSKANKPENLIEHRLSPNQYKILLSELLSSLAWKIYRKECYDEGMSSKEWKLHQVENIEECEENVSRIGKQLIRENKTPVHLMSDEEGAIRRIAQFAEFDEKLGRSVSSARLFF